MKLIFIYRLVTIFSKLIKKYFLIKKSFLIKIKKN